MSFRKPDYDGLRRNGQYHWYVGSSYYALLGLVPDISIKEICLDPDAMIELYRKGLPLFEDIFGARVRPMPLATPGISYAHINGLGIELVFPDGGEVNYERPEWSLDEVIAVLREKIDYSREGMIPFYLDYQEKLKRVFKRDDVGLSLGYEGPLTTAYELRDMNVFTDVYDDPEKFKLFLDLIVESVADFAEFRRKVEGHPRVDPSGCSLCDDVASMFHPDMWPEFVLPYFHRFFEALTTGERSAHIEDLAPEHLPYLEEVGLVSYDPSISPKLNPRLITEYCRVPFGWRLGCFHYATMTEKDVRDWVFQATADGAAYVFTLLAQTMMNGETIPKVFAFMDAAEEAEKMMESGVSRKDLRKEVSVKGRVRFFDSWPD